MQLTNYTINSITGLDYDITFTFDDGTTSEQVIHLIATNADDLDIQIQAYAIAYCNGLTIEIPVVPDDIQSIVAKPQMTNQHTPPQRIGG